MSVLSIGEADRRFAILFDGNPEVYGTEKGGCVRDPLAEGVVAHLDGDKPVGVYPTYENLVSWGCVDLDVRTEHKPSGDYKSPNEAHEAAEQLRACLSYFGIYGYIERTRSDGRHIWVFVEEPIHASFMRRALRVACVLAQVSSREVNPKQELLPEGKLGNYVRLPYPARTSDDGGCRIFVTDGIPLGYREALTMIKYSSEANIAFLATFWQERSATARPRCQHIDYGSAPSRASANLLRWANTIMPDDRSSALWWIANTLGRENVPYSEAEQAIMQIMVGWGKHQGREQEETNRILKKVYG